MTLRRALPLLAIALLADTTFACTADGAFGIAFGSKAPRGARKLYVSGAATWYEVRPPRPDPRFDRYEIRVDKTNETYEVVGITSIIPQPRTSEEAARITPEQKAEGAAKAEALALQYLEALPPEMRAALKPDDYSAASWRGLIAENLLYDISADVHWGVRVACTDRVREARFGRRALQEALGKK